MVRVCRGGAGLSGEAPHSPKILNVLIAVAKGRLTDPVDKASGTDPGFDAEVGLMTAWAVPEVYRGGTCYTDAFRRVVRLATDTPA